MVLCSAVLTGGGCRGRFTSLLRSSACDNFSFDLAGLVDGVEVAELLSPFVMCLLQCDYTAPFSWILTGHLVREPRVRRCHLGRMTLPAAGRIPSVCGGYSGLYFVRTLSNVPWMLALGTLVFFQ